MNRGRKKKEKKKNMHKFGLLQAQLSVTQLNAGSQKVCSAVTLKRD
jgi:hypothetical protein